MLLLCAAEDCVVTVRPERRYSQEKITLKVQAIRSLFAKVVACKNCSLI